MIPVLYRPEETAFTTMGIGALADIISCEVTEERNGIYEVIFTYPITGAHYSDIKEGCIILCRHDDTLDMQPFDIYARSAPIDGVVTFYAHHISYRLSKTIVSPFTAGSITQAMARLKSYSITTNPFSFWTDKTVEANFNVAVPSAVRSLLAGQQGSILDVYGSGEYKFDRFAVRLYQNRGTDSGVQIRYGKNMLDITHEYDVSGSYSAVAPYWQSSDGSQVVTAPIVFGESLMMRDSVWTIESGEHITDENDTDIDIRYAIVETVPMDLSGDFETAPTVGQLKELAQRRLNNSQAWLPDENITVDFEALWQTPEYASVAALQRLSLCDTVSVYYPALGVSAVKQKVIKVVYDVLAERYTEMELGKPKTTFADVIKAQTEGMLEDIPTRSFMQAAIDYASDLIRGGLGGHVVIGTNADGQPNEILIMDTTDKLTAQNVLRMNLNGIAFSTTGYDGPFTTAWTIDGHFVADFIDTGRLNANLLKVGMIIDQTDSESKNYWNLETGELSMVGYATDAEVEAAINTYDNQLDQLKVFNKLTDNGAAQGIILTNGNLYVNATYINTGAFTVTQGGTTVFSANVDTGEVMISGNAVTIAGTQIETAMNAAAADAVDALEIGGRNLIRNSNDLDYDGYYFYSAFTANGSRLTVNGKQLFTRTRGA